MEDGTIVKLYFARSVRAITETERKYGSYCYSIANHILSNREDAQECVNDTYLAAWNTMPPQKHRVLSAFLGRITRNIYLDKWKRRVTQKRGGGEVPLCLEELEECVSNQASAEDTVLRRETVACVQRFLAQLPETERRVFVCRYWYMDSVKEIEDRFGFAAGKVTAMLHRTRAKLRKRLSRRLPLLIAATLSLLAGCAAVYAVRAVNLKLAHGTIPSRYTTHP